MRNGLRVALAVAKEVNGTAFESGLQGSGSFGFEVHVAIERHLKHMIQQKNRVL